MWRVRVRRTMAERGEVAGRRAYMVSINDREMQVMRCSLVKRRNVRWAGISSGRLMRYVTPRDLRTVDGRGRKTYTAVCPFSQIQTASTNCLLNMQCTCCDSFSRQGRADSSCPRRRPPTLLPRPDLRGLDPSSRLSTINRSAPPPSPPPYRLPHTRFPSYAQSVLG